MVGERAGTDSLRALEEFPHIGENEGCGSADGVLA